MRGVGSVELVNIAWARTASTTFGLPGRSSYAPREITQSSWLLAATEPEKKVKLGFGVRSDADRSATSSPRASLASTSTAG